MSIYNAGLFDFEMEVDETLEDVSEHHYNLQPAREETNLKQTNSLPEQKNTLFDSNVLQMNDCSGDDVQNVRNIETSTHGTDNYSELDLNKYLNLIDSPTSCPSKQYVDSGRSQCIEEFFHDFYEIVSSEIEKPSKAHEHSVANLDPSQMLIFDDQSKNVNSNGSDVGFNLDLTQFYVDAPHGSDVMMLQSPDVATSFHSHLQPPYEVFNGNTFINTYSEPIQHSNGQAATDFSQVNTDTLANGQLQQFYSDFDQNCDVASGSNEDNSIITFMKKEGVESLQYANNHGATETIMYVGQASNDMKDKGVPCFEYVNDSEETLVYVDQASNGQNENAHVVNLTSYEIIDYDAHQHGNFDSTLHNYQISSSPVENVDSNGQSQDECRYTSYHPDLLSSLLLDTNNKIIIMAKPLKNPKIREDEFQSKFADIDANPPNIPFLKRPTIKGCRKQKLELINEIDTPVLISPERRRGRPNKIIKAMVSNATFIHETPKLPSKYIRDHKKHTNVRRKNPRKLFWDSDSDCETGNCNVEDSADDNTTV